MALGRVPFSALVSSDYILNGYEAFFGTYEVDEKAQTTIRHVEGSITRGRVGKSLTRAYRFSNGRLTMRSVHPREPLVGDLKTVRTIAARCDLPAGHWTRAGPLSSKCKDARATGGKDKRGVAGVQRPIAGPVAIGVDR